jgi:hypothetical protein
MEVDQCQCSKTYSWQIHAAQGNHDFRTANLEQALEGRMKPIENLENERCKVSTYLRKAYWNTASNCLWRFEYCLHETLIIVSLVFIQYFRGEDKHQSKLRKDVTSQLTLLPSSEQSGDKEHSSIVITA